MWKNLSSTSLMDCDLSENEGRKVGGKESESTLKNSDFDTLILFSSMTNMTGRPGGRTVEMTGGSAASYLARTPCVHMFIHLCLETEGLLDFQG